MDVALSSPVNVEPSPAALRFNSRSPNLGLPHSPTSPQFATDLPLPPTDPVPSLYPPSEMDTGAPSEQQQPGQGQDRTDPSMQSGMAGADHGGIEATAEAPVVAQIEGATDDDAMDTTTDTTQPVAQPDASAVPSPTTESNEELPPQTSTNHEPQPAVPANMEGSQPQSNLVRLDSNGGTVDTRSEGGSGDEAGQATPEGAPAPNAETTSPPSAGDSDLFAVAPPPPPATADQPPAEPPSSENQPPAEENQEGNSQERNKPPTEEAAYWADIVEDTSVPDEAELKEIEAADEDYSATDVKFWEDSFYSDLEDPEYEPIEKARITWKFKGVRGTKEKPNRALIMRSPAAFVGGYYWTIKFFPRGNRVNALSCYVECSATPPKEDTEIPETWFKVVKASPSAVLSETAPDIDITLPATTALKEEPAPANLDPQKEESNDQKEDSSEEMVVDTNDDQPAASTETSTSSEVQDVKDWRATAQLGVIIYNPEEPRTGWHQTSSHQFNPHNSDWGWTNFHGPWDSIHKRQRGQRQALLRNDTLAIDAYIRIIKDPTQALWWHSSDSEPVWNSLSLTGFRAMGNPSIEYSNETAGLVPLLLLAPFRKIIQNVDVEGHQRNSQVKPKPLCERLQRILYLMRKQKKDELYVNTHSVFRTLEELGETSMDMVTFWERFRRTLELELKFDDSGALQALSDIFDGRPIGEVENFNAAKDWISSGGEISLRIPVEEVDSIQRGMDKVLTERSVTWSLPKLLQIEMDRQKFDKGTRQWQMLYQKIRLNDSLDLSPWSVHEKEGYYTLYGFVVHVGERSSGKFYSIVRPGGPNTKWLAFEDGSENKVECLTNKHTFEAHEGLEGDALKNNKSTHSVAQVALYVRNDVLTEYLPGKLEPWEASHWLEKHTEIRENVNEDEDTEEEDSQEGTVALEIYSSSNIRDREGLIDAYDLLSKSRETDRVQYLTVPSSTLVPELQNKLSLWVPGIEKPEQIRLWDLGCFSTTNSIRVCLNRLDGKQSTSYPAKILDVYPSNLRPLRLWMHILPLEDVKDFGVPQPPPPTDAFNDSPAGDEEGSEASAPAEPEGTPRPANAENETANPEQTDVAMNDAPAPAAEPAETREALGVTDTTSPERDGEPGNVASPAVEGAPTEESRPNNDVAEGALAESSGTNNDVAMTPPEDDAVIAAIITGEVEAMEALLDAPPTETLAEAPTTNPPAIAEGVDGQRVESTPEPALQPNLSSADITTEVLPEAFPTAEIVPQTDTEAPRQQGVTAQVPTPTQEDAVMEDTPSSEDAPTERAQTDEGAASTENVPMEAPATADAPIENAQTDEGAASTENVPMEAPATADAPIENAQTNEGAAAENEDEVVESADAADTNANNGAHAEVPFEPLVLHLYVFIQFFDAKKQSFTTLGSFIAKMTDNIKDAIRKDNQWPAEKDFSMWECSDSFHASSIGSGSNFGNLKVLCDGTIIIIGDVLSKSEMDELESSGSFCNPKGLLHFLWMSARNHPMHAFTGETTFNVFGEPYYSGSWKNGLSHGTGTSISDAGSQYTGSFVLGARHGNGIMTYPNGDTYTGAFASNERHGEGTFIEHKTGNKYVGGYKEGKRHGKGVSYWEVADEEMNLCQICYGNEQDALFYDCGHVCACVECANMVEVCPICRRNVVAVVRIYRS